MNPIKIITAIICSTLISITAVAQSGSTTGMADEMRSNGRIYVVVAVVLTILGGLILYLVRLDQKIKKLEKDHSQ